MSVVGAALVPAAPVMVPELSGSLHPAAEPHEAMLRAVGGLLDAGPEHIVVIAEGEGDATFGTDATWALHRLGGGRAQPGEGAGAVLPIPLALGASMLRQAGWTGSVEYRSIQHGAPASNAFALARDLIASPRRIGLLLLGNGSACSTEKAPGSLHPEAGAFNAELLRVIGSGDLAQLRLLEPSTFVDQRSDAWLPLQVLAEVSAGRSVAARVDFADDFRGVFYLCAVISMAGPTDGSSDSST